MGIWRQEVARSQFNDELDLPFDLRQVDFESAMQDVYDFFFDVNKLLVEKGLPRLDDMLRPAACSGMISDMVTASLANHSRVLTENRYHNGHPDLIAAGRYANNAVQSGSPADGIEVKTTRNPSGAVDTHGARNQWFCVFVYEVDNETEPAIQRDPLIFRKVYLVEVQETDFRHNSRGPLGTRTSTLHRQGLQRMRDSWVYINT